MQIFIGCSKTMTGIVPRLITGCTEPRFQRNADSLAIHLGRYSAEELQDMLHCNATIARETRARYRRFIDPSTRRPAVFSYDGMVFRKIDADSMSDADIDYAKSHLFIGSFLYGLLRPLDLINQYRLEGNVTLPSTGHITMLDYWKPILTDWFIEQVKADDGILINLASREFRNIFDWKRVEKELTVISPEFLVEKPDGLKTVVVYAKMCRGAMTRWIIQNRITDTADLEAFEYEGFKHEDSWNYILRT